MKNKIRNFIYQHKKSIIFITLFFLSLYISFTHFSKNNLDDSTNENVLSANIELLTLEDFEGEDNDKILNVLLLGYGGAGHQGGFLTDVIMVAHFNFDDNILAFISIPRDTWYQNRKVNQLLNFVNGKVNADNIKSAISNITGLKIEYYIGIDFVGFERAVGQDLDSITVDVPQTFEDSWYPIKGEELNPCSKTPEEIATLTNTLSGFALEKEFECRYQHLYFEKGLNQMEGGDALAYVRSRHSSSDFARSERQKAVLLGIKDKIFDTNALTNSANFFKTMDKHVSTDLNIEIIEFLLPLLSSADDLQPKGIVLSTENVFSSSTGSSGQFILIPKDNWINVTAYIKSQLQN